MKAHAFVRPHTEHYGGPQHERCHVCGIRKAEHDGVSPADAANETARLESFASRQARKAAELAARDDEDAGAYGRYDSVADQLEARR